MIDDKTMDRLRTHSKQHKGGMGSKHIRNMKKFLNEGMSFTKAHNKAKKMDAENNNKGLTEKQKKLPEALKKAIKKSNNKDKPRPKPMGMKKTKAMGKTSY